MKTIKTVCHRDCPDTCFVDVTVDRGTIIATRGSTLNPVTRGFLCPRGNGDPQRVYSNKRVLHPHANSGADGSGSFSRVSWDVALSAVSERIQATIDTHGRESLLLYDYPGNTGLLAWHFARRLWFALGATTTDYALCSSSGHTGIGLHYGLSYGLQLTDMAASKVILFWGNNVKVTDKVLTGTLWAPRPLTGLNDVPLNALVPGTSQGIGGGPIFNSVKVKIKRVAGFSGNGESERSAGIKGK